MFVDGRKQGQGTWKKSSTDEKTNIYEGEYHDDMKHGYGEFRWATGGHYRGEYVNDVKVGFGTMTWVDGSVFKGAWENGIQNGLGLMIFANGSKKAGFFIDNVLTELLTDSKMITNFESKLFFP